MCDYMDEKHYEIDIGKPFTLSLCINSGDKERVESLSQSYGIDCMSQIFLYICALGDYHQSCTVQADFSPLEP